MKHNDPASAIKARLDELQIAVDAFSAIGDLRDSAQATRCADLKREIDAVLGEIDHARTTEKAPFVADARRVDERYKPLSEVATAFKIRVAGLLSAHLIRQRQAIALAAALAADARKAADAAVVEARESGASETEIAELEADARRAADHLGGLEGKRALIGSQLGGRKAVGLRRGKVTTTIDAPGPAMAWAWKNHRAEVLELVGRLAAADARQGVRDIPGVTIEIEEIAV